MATNPSRPGASPRIHAATQKRFTVALRLCGIREVAFQQQTSHPFLTVHFLSCCPATSTRILVLSATAAQRARPRPGQDSGRAPFGAVRVSSQGRERARLHNEKHEREDSHHKSGHALTRPPGNPKQNSHVRSNSTRKKNWAPETAGVSPVLTKRRVLCVRKEDLVHRSKAHRLKTKSLQRHTTSGGVRGREPAWPAPGQAS
jgi:hypothetical protein